MEQYAHVKQSVFTAGLPVAASYDGKLMIDDGSLHTDSVSTLLINVIETSLNIFSFKSIFDYINKLTLFGNKSFH